MSENNTEIARSTFAINLRKLVPLRFFTIIFFAVVIAFAVLGLGIRLPVPHLTAVLVAMTVLNATTVIYLRYNRPVSERTLFGHFILDAVGLTALLFLSGGWTNPFVSLYLLTIALTATVLPGRYTWTMVGITAACYTTLVFWYLPMPVSHDFSGSGFGLHVVGMWLGFLLASVAIAFFMVRMAATLRARDHELALMQQSALRNEQMVALATLATGAAHELGTPLGTMAILVNDIKAGQAVSNEQREILNQQIKRCKDILGAVTASAGVLRAEEGEQAVLDDFLKHTVEQWRAIRPGVSVNMELDKSLPVPRIVSERTLSQAIMNILNNAAEASSGTIDVYAQWGGDVLVLEVADKGEGVSPEVLENKGTPFITTKPSGQGLGLFLVQSTMDRLGGRLDFVTREGGGTVCRVELPLAPLLVNN